GREDAEDQVEAGTPVGRDEESQADADQLHHHDMAIADGHDARVDEAQEEIERQSTDNAGHGAEAHKGRHEALSRSALALVVSLDGGNGHARPQAALPSLIVPSMRSRQGDSSSTSSPRL